LTEFHDAVREALAADTFIQLVLSSPAGSMQADTVQRLTVRPVDLKSGRKLQITQQEQRRETHRNVEYDELLDELDTLFGATFRNANLFTSEADISATMKSAGRVKFKRQPPSKSPVETSHNRSKQYLIPDGTPCPFLIETGVMSRDGHVRKSKYDKFRQINRFLEFVEDVYESLPSAGTIRVVDFGCGKSYLTFALHYLLTAIHQRDVAIIGLDLKADVVEHCNATAEKLGCTGLRFVAGDMASYSPEAGVDLSVSLHACDTATDVALARAVAWEASVILSVPCCHHELASAIARSALAPVQCYGILHARLAETATDGLRATLLELAGYRTQVLEFISTEHTPKNLLIRATRRMSPVDTTALAAEYEATKRLLGIDSFELERLLAIS